MENQTKPQNIKTKIQKTKPNPNRSDRLTEKVPQRNNQTVQAVSQGDRGGDIQAAVPRPRRWDGAGLAPVTLQATGGRRAMGRFRTFTNYTRTDVVRVMRFPSIVQLWFQRGLVVTLGLDPGRAAWLQCGCWEPRGGESCTETEVEVRHERSEHAGALYIWQ